LLLYVLRRRMYGCTAAGMWRIEFKLFFAEEVFETLHRQCFLVAYMVQGNFIILGVWKSDNGYYQRSNPG